MHSHTDLNNLVTEVSVEKKLISNENYHVCREHALAPCSPQKLHPPPCLPTTIEGETVLSQEPDKAEPRKTC